MLEVNDSVQLSGLPFLTSSTMTKIEQILATGTTKKLEQFRNSEKSKALLQLSKIFAKTRAKANKLYVEGFRSLQDLLDAAKSGDLPIGFSKLQRFSLENFKDLAQKITKAEGDEFLKFVQDKFPKFKMMLVGAHRRKLQDMRSVEVLICDPSKKNSPRKIIAEVVKFLNSQGAVADVKYAGSNPMDEEEIKEIKGVFLKQERRSSLKHLRS